jgi:hypothetical protein
MLGVVILSEVTRNEVLGSGQNEVARSRRISLSSSQLTAIFSRKRDSGRSFDSVTLHFASLHCVSLRSG